MNGDYMILLFDIILLIPISFLLFFRHAEANEKRIILFILGITLSLFSVRRISTSVTAFICVTASFFACLILKRLYKYFSNDEYIVISYDEQNNSYLITNGKKTESLICGEKEMYKVGEIVRITSKFN